MQTGSPAKQPLAIAPEVAETIDLDFTVDGLRNAGFNGFITFADLLDGIDIEPSSQRRRVH